MTEEEVIDEAWGRSHKGWNYAKNGPLHIPAKIQSSFMLSDASAIPENTTADIVVFGFDTFLERGEPWFMIVGEYRGFKKIVREGPLTRK